MDSRLLIVTFCFPIWFFLIIYFRKYRQWLLYYLFAAFGFTLIFTLLAEHFGWDQILVDVAAFHTSLLGKFLGVPNEILSNGRIVINDANILKLGIECSAILEILTLVGLVVFYPAFSWKNKIFKLFLGVAATYTINILRMLVIVFITYKLGVSYIFIAHAVIGRLVFFVLMIAIYWFLLTGPTIELIGKSLREKVTIPKAQILRRIGLKRMIAGIGFLIFVVLAIGSSLFYRSDWLKAFDKPEKVERPIIYEEETEVTQCQDCGSILGDKTEETSSFDDKVEAFNKPKAVEILLFPKVKEREITNWPTLPEVADINEEEITSAEKLNMEGLNEQ